MQPALLALLPEVLAPDDVVHEGVREPRERAADLRRGVGDDVEVRRHLADADLVVGDDVGPLATLRRGVADLHERVTARRLADAPVGDAIHDASDPAQAPVQFQRRAPPLPPVVRDREPLLVVALQVHQHRLPVAHGDFEVALDQTSVGRLDRLRDLDQARPGEQADQDLLVLRSPREVGPPVVEVGPRELAPLLRALVARDDEQPRVEVRRLRDAVQERLAELEALLHLPKILRLFCGLHALLAIYSL